MQRTPYLAYSMAQDFVSKFTAPLEAAYILNLGLPSVPEAEEILMMDPFPFSII